jgi:tRNA_anti-like/Leucine Rich repeat
MTSRPVRLLVATALGLTALGLTVCLFAGCGNPAGKPGDPPPPKPPKSVVDEPGRENPPDPEPPRVVVSAVDLTRALAGDAAAAGKQYRGKVLRIEGVITQVDLRPDHDGAWDALVRLQGAQDDPNAPSPPGVVVRLKDRKNTDRLGKGQKVTVEGKYLQTAERQAMIGQAKVVMMGPVAIAQAEIDRLKKEEPRVVAALRKLNVIVREGVEGVDVKLACEHVTAGGEIRADVLALLTKVAPIGVLSLAGTPLSDVGVARLKELPTVESILLSGTRVGDAGLVHLKDLPYLNSLTGLELGGARVTDEGLAQLAGLTALRKLDLNNSKIGDAGLAHLKELKRLEMLQLAGTPVTGKGLAHLKGLTWLSRLDLSESELADAGLAHLQGLPNLTVVQLRDTRVGDAGMAHLAKLPRLRVLFVGGTDVGDAGVQHLGAVKSLKLLSLGKDAKVTAEGIAKLKEALPGLQVLRGP